MSLPMRGAWIEIKNGDALPTIYLSRSPCGERGLKYVWYTANCLIGKVAPPTGSVD